MKRNNGLSILCGALVLGAVFTFPSFAEMKKVNDTELARANASVTGAVRPKTAQAAATFDKTALVFFPETNKVSEGFRLNLQPGPETTHYYHPAYNNGTNQWYWGGGSTTVRSPLR